MPTRASLSVLAVLALLALSTSLASAEGVNLYWSDCGAGGNGQSNMTFACNTNDARFDLYLSVDPPPGVVSTTGHNQFIVLQSASSPLPAWWDFHRPGTCRLTELAPSGDFSTSTSGGGDCADPWLGTGSGGTAAYMRDFEGDPSRARFIGSIASTYSTAMTPGVEYYSMKLRIFARKTVGTTACAGCLDPVCLVLSSVRIAQAGGPDLSVVNPLDQNYVTWQGGDSGSIGCPAKDSVPTQNASWGKVKALYR